MRAQVTNNAAGIGDQRRSRKPQVRREAGGSEPTESDHVAGRAGKGRKTRRLYPSSANADRAMHDRLQDKKGCQKNTESDGITVGKDAEGVGRILT
jgi:hypothetical protein